MLQQDVTDEGSATEEECAAGPVLTRAQAKKSDKIHPLKVKEAISSVKTSLRKKIFRRRILL